MHTSLSQGIGKRGNGSSSTGCISYSDRVIDSSATSILGNNYAFSTDGYSIDIESIPQRCISENGLVSRIEYFRISIGTLRDNLKCPIKFNMQLSGHENITTWQKLAAYLDTDFITIRDNAIAYSLKAKVARVRQQIAPKITANDRYSIHQNNRYKARKQSKLNKGLWIG